MSVVKKFLGDTVIYGLSTIVSRMLNFLLTPLFVKKFPAAVYGVFTNLYAYASMLNALLAFGMETTYFRYLQKVEKEQKNQVFNNSFFVTILTVALFLLCVVLFVDPIAAWLGDGKDVDDYVLYTKYFAAILASDAIAVIPFAKLRAEGRPLFYGALKLINIFVLVVSNLFLLYWLPSLMEGSAFWQHFASGWFKPNWLGNIFISNLLASVVTLLMLIPQMASFSFKSVDRKVINSMIKYSFPILIANISFIINENLDKMMFPRLMPGAQGDQDLGIYGAVAKLAVFLNLFVTAFRLGAEPFFFSYSKNENARRTYAVIMDYFVIAMVLVMVGICANMDWLKNFIKGSQEQQAIYWSGLYIVPILLFNYVLLGIYMNLSVWYKLSDQTIYALYISGIGAVITIVLNVLLIPRYSYMGAVGATTIVYVVMVTLSYIWGQRNYPIPYNLKKIVLFLVAGVALSWTMFNVLHSNVWICNGLLILFLIGVAFVEKDNLRKIIKR